MNNHLDELGQQSSIHAQMKLIEDHITYSNDREYERILNIVQKNKHLNMPKTP
jgi:hypothetical protein